MYVSCVLALRAVKAGTKASSASCNCMQVIFIDELDAIAPSRSGSPGLAASSGGGGGVSGRLVTALLLEMDGLQGVWLDSQPMNCWMVAGKQGAIPTSCTKTSLMPDAGSGLPAHIGRPFNRQKTCQF